MLGLIGSWRADGRDLKTAPPEPLVGGTNTIPASELRAVEALRGSLNVRAPLSGATCWRSRLTSPEPEEAARLADAVAETYLVDKLDARLEAAKRASAWLGDRLVGLRAQLRKSEEAVAQFRAQHRLVQSGGATTLSQQQLSELNLTLIQARADLAQKKAASTSSARFRRKAVASKTCRISPERRRCKRCARIKPACAQEADLLARYNRGDPLVVNIRAQVQDVERSIGSETARFAAGIRNEYELARTCVASLEQNVQQATGQSNVDDATAIRLRELERTAAVNKTLFEDFLKQAKVTEEQSTFEPQDARIITPALVPDNPSYPNQARFMTVNLLIGLLFGVGGAFARDKLNSGFTTPRQIEDFLGLPLLDIGEPFEFA